MHRLSAIFSVLLMLGIPFLRATAQQAMPPTPQEQSSTGAHRLNIRGTVFDNQTLEPMQGATVKLFNQRDSMLTGTITTDKGQFLLPGIRAGKEVKSLEGLTAGKYTVKVSYIGYKEQVFGVTLPERSGNFKVSDIMMRENVTVMKEAVVEGRLPELTVVDDTVMYNADAFKLEEGAMVEELIRKLPGIVEESEGNYTFNGKSVSQILVDGKEFFGNNRRMVLENLPAEIVDKVKAYDRKSDRNTI